MKTLMYKGKPLVRQGRFIFYGHPDEKYILFMNILETKMIGSLEIATKELTAPNSVYSVRYTLSPHRITE